MNRIKVYDILKKADKLLYNNRDLNTDELYRELNKALEVSSTNPVIKAIMSYAYETGHSDGRYNVMSIYANIVQDIFHVVEKYYTLKTSL